MSQNTNLINIPSTIPAWSWSQNNASLDTSVLSPKGQQTIKLLAGTQRELEMVGVAVKPGDHIVYKVWTKSTGNTATHGTRNGIDFYGGGGRICGLNMNDGRNIFYAKDGSPLNGATGGAWADETNVKWGAGWTLCTIDFIVPATLQGDGWRSLAGDAALREARVPSFGWFWVDAMPYQDSGTAWFGDGELYINPAVTTPPANVTIAVTGQGTTSPAAGNIPSTYKVGDTLNVIATPAQGWQYQKMQRNGVDWTTANPGEFLSLAATETINVVFVQSVGTLEVHAYSGGQEVTATVSMGNQSGNTPFTIQVAAGTVTLSCAYQNGSLTQTVTVNAGQTTQVSFNFTPVVTANVTGAMAVAGIVILAIAGIAALGSGKKK